MNKKIIYPELSYKVMGVIFEIAKKLPPGLPEKDYKKTLALLFNENKIPFEREVYIPVTIADTVVSKYFADFIIDSKIVLEIKVSPMLGYAQARQLLAYLRAGNYQLGILVYFTKNGVQYRRIINDMFV